jgi:hypothetical protein
MRFERAPSGSACLVYWKEGLLDPVPSGPVLYEMAVPMPSHGPSIREMIEECGLEERRPTPNRYANLIRRLRKLPHLGLFNRAIEILEEWPAEPTYDTPEWLARFPEPREAASPGRELSAAVAAAESFRPGEAHRKRLRRVGLGSLARRAAGLIVGEGPTAMAGHFFNRGGPFVGDFVLPRPDLIALSRPDLIALSKATACHLKWNLCQLKWNRT